MCFLPKEKIFYANEYVENGKYMKTSEQSTERKKDKRNKKNTEHEHGTRYKERKS